MAAGCTAASRDSNAPRMNRVDLGVGGRVESGRARLRSLLHDHRALHSQHSIMDPLSVRPGVVLIGDLVHTGRPASQPDGPEPAAPRATRPSRRTCTAASAVRPAMPLLASVTAYLYRPVLGLPRAHCSDAQCGLHGRRPYPHGRDLLCFLARGREAAYAIAAKFRVRVTQTPYLGRSFKVYLSPWVENPTVARVSTSTKRLSATNRQTPWASQCTAGCHSCARPARARSGRRSKGRSCSVRACAWKGKRQ